MSKLRKKGLVHNFLHSKMVLAGLVLVAVFTLQSVYERYEVEREMAVKRNEVETELRELQARQATLQKEVEYLSHERGIEAEMRRQFDVALPGEQVVIILDEEAEAETTGVVAGAATSTPEEDEPWYKFW